MSKIGNLRSDSYSWGNSHPYGAKVKPKRTLADVRKARELAQKKARKVTPLRISEYKPAQEAEIISQEELLKAQAERRTSQAAEKAARKASRQGKVTVFDASKGLHVSAMPQEAKLIEAANKSKLVETADKTLGGTTKSKGLWGSVKELFGKAKNAFADSFSKSKAFTKTPKGKFGIAIAALVLAGSALLAYVTERFSDRNNPTPTAGPDKIFMPKFRAQVNKTDKSKSAKAVTVAEKKEADEAAKANENKREPDKVSGNEYEVVKGDCVWNIAKAHLKELNKDKADYVPSNVEILRRTKEIMEINDLHYEADNYVVIIQPGQKIKLT